MNRSDLSPNKWKENKTKLPDWRRKDRPETSSIEILRWSIKLFRNRTTKEEFKLTISKDNYPPLKIWNLKLKISGPILPRKIDRLDNLKILFSNSTELKWTWKLPERKWKNKIKFLKWRIKRLNNSLIEIINSSKK